MRPRRLRGLRSSEIPLAFATVQPSTPAQIMAAAAQSTPVGGGGALPDVNDVCSTLDFFFDPASWQACVAAVIAGGPQSVVANATAAGYPPNVIAIAQNAANQQSGQAPADAANIAQFYGAGSLITTGSIPAWVWWAIGIGGGVLLLKVLR